MLMYAQTSNAVARMAFAGLALGAACVAIAEPADVPRGGATIENVAGSERILLEIKNTTGKPAQDVTVVLLNADGVEIERLDILGTTEDVVDDNGNGMVEEREETDTIARVPGRVIKSILKEGQIVDGDEASLVIVFDRPPGDNAQLLVKLSTEIGGVHFDMLAAAPLVPADATLVAVEPGAAQVSTELVSAGDSPIETVMIEPVEPTAEAWPPHEVMADYPMEWWVDGGVVRVRLLDPLAPDQAVELGMILPVPVEAMDDRFDLVLQAEGGARPCYPDFDGDGRLTLFDFLTFQNEFADRAARADCDADGRFTILDFLCFQNAFDAGCP